MSVVVVTNTDDAVYVGADSAVTYGEGQQVLVDGAKIFHVGKIVGGGTGSADHVTLFRVFLEDVQAKNDIGHTLSDIVTLWANFVTYVEPLHLDLYEGDYVLSQFVVVIDKHPWLIEGFYAREVEAFDAIGSGAAVARAALHFGHTIIEALDAACHFDAACRFPLLVYEIPKDGSNVLLTKYEKSGIVSARQLPPSSNGQDATVLTL